MMKSKHSLSTALKMLSRRRMTVKQLSQKLGQKGIPVKEISEVVDSLQEWDYLNDHSYAVAYCKSRRDKYSRYRIRMNLAQSGIDQDTIAEVLQEFYLEDREYANCLELGLSLLGREQQRWQKKKDSNKQPDYVMRAYIKKKIGDKLLQKGYSIHIVRRILEKITDKENF